MKQNCIKPIGKNLKFGLMIMAILSFSGSLQAQWGPSPGYVGENLNNPEMTLFGTPDAFVVNTALIECTDPSLGLPPGDRATLAALVWADLSGDVYLWVEYAHRDFTSPPDCYDFADQDNVTIQVNSADAIHPDVIIRDHPNNPGVDYIISVIYTENDMITLNEYEVIGLPTININLINSIQLFTATYRPNEIPGSFPKIDGFINPENQINDYYEMGGFAVVWQTNLGVELQVFDASSTPIHEALFPMIYQGSLIEKFTLDVAAIVDRDPSGSSDYNQIVAISFNHAEYNGLLYDHGVLEMNITYGNIINMYSFSGVTVGSSNSRIDGMGIVAYPNARWVTMSTNDCGNAAIFTNISLTSGQSIPSYLNHSAFQNYTVTA